MLKPASILEKAVRPPVHGAKGEKNRIIGIALAVIIVDRNPTPENMKFDVGSISEEITD